MKILFADEADQNAKNTKKFFVYGAAMFDAGKTKRITERVEQIRADSGYQLADSLKFAESDRPKQITKEVWISAKAEVLKLAREQNVRFFGYCVHHGVAKNRGYAELLEWGANTIISKYQQYLKENNEVGYCCFDRWDNQEHFNYQSRKFRERLVPEKEGLRADRIVGLGTVCDGSSHLASVADICVGSFRYVINEPERDMAGKELARLLKPLFWGVSHSGTKSIHDRGLVMRPQNWSEKYPKFAPDYAETVSRLIDWANSET